MKNCKLDSALKRYCRSVRKKLVCPAKLRREMLGRLRESIADFLDERPNADMADITARFGTPEQIARSVSSFWETPPTRHCRRCARGILAPLAACLLFFAALAGAVSAPGSIGGHSAENTASVFYSCVFEKELPGLNAPLVIEVRSVRPPAADEAEEGWQRLCPVLTKDLRAAGYR